MTSAWIETWVMVFIPIGFFVVALFNEKIARWRLAANFSLFGLALTVLMGAAAIAGWVNLDQPSHWFIPSASSLVMLGLVNFIAYINIRYSSAYMAGNVDEERRYLSWLMVTLGSVSMVVVSNHMLLFMVAWIAISLSLHRLLIFFPQRQRAVLAAHKKYIFARVAELCLLGAILILHFEHDTWLISEVYQNVSQATALSTLDHWAAVLLALAALVKCAQLPLHGWLIQVVEAPTPVSALLHAGIINLGGYLLIIFAPLIVLSDAAQWLLLIVGGITTVLAALVMMTRASVKVRLAWSTMSQMGLMLVECALGLFELALLHLLAHSCYKAYAFLNSGSEVEASMKRRLSLAVAPTRLDWWLGGLIAASLVAALIWAAEISGPYSPWLLLAIALTLLIAERRGRLSVASVTGMMTLAGVLLVAYTLQKNGVGIIVPSMPTSVGWPGDLWIAVLLGLFMAGYILMRYHADQPWMVKTRRAFYAGFYLDEWVTRLNLRLYPTRLPVRFKPKKLQIPKEELYR
ncbi:NADH-quinone oxidoreductase subunit L [Thiomicrospira sp. WB1]|uniref:NADH-quinone oxidoreductase subunit L n=1 Tax=Thiomicrospira sp. WB1 TaxID=1685380 RepID=UPI000746628E|nr:NADH-quinone oxidoreductase subunit L [Thiomicrospira sp. WB1]KUJ72774.1 NADH dehydrogenase [Thiomicrospira sp. WB1]